MFSWFKSKWRLILELFFFCWEYNFSVPTRNSLRVATLLWPSDWVAFTCFLQVNNSEVVRHFFWWVQSKCFFKGCRFPNIFIAKMNEKCSDGFSHIAFAITHFNSNVATILCSVNVSSSTIWFQRSMPFQQIRDTGTNNGNTYMYLADK